MVHELTDVSFNEFVQKDVCVIIDFYATWCPPCDRLAPIMHEIAEEYRNQIVVGQINVDKNPETVERYGVMSTPTLLVFHRGQVVSNFVGYRPKQNIVDLLGLSVM